MVLIPTTDLNVFPICLGTGQSGLTMDRTAAFRMFDAYAAAGGNFIDSAKVYTDWLPGERSASEKAIGEWLRQRRNRAQVVIATKGAHPELGSMHTPRLSQAKITGDLDASLRNLGVDTIDLYWLHRDDPVRPVSDILETLAKQAQAGKIRYYGCSNWTTRRIREAQDFATRHELPGFVANQARWSLAVVDPEGIKDDTQAPMDDEMLAYHRQTGLPAIPFSSQAGGLFAKLAEGRATLPQDGPYRSPRNLARLERVLRLNRQTGYSLTQIVLGYLLSQPFFTLPVVGPRTPEQLADSLSAAEIRLTPEQVSFLEV